ncbi:MAG TPA: transporter substrate-binding domain-containing protein [Vicinamibacteria bacterium]|nr:transporter substrate-binding domain-containing protein [Vicinamibacteria bacterium]
MNKALTLGLAIVAAAPASAELGDVKARGTLRVLVSADEQPEMYALAPGGAPGFDREVLDGFAGLQRIRVETVVRPFEAIIGALVKGEGDVLVGLVDTEARRRQIAFTGEVLPTRLVVLTRKPQPAIVKLEELRAARVGVVKGTSWAEAVAAAGVPAAQTESVAELSDALDGLKAKRFAATVVSLVDASLAIRKDRELQAGLFLGTPGRAAYALRKGEPELLRALDEYLGNLRKTGSWSRLVVKYFGDDALAVLGRARQ